MAIGSDPELPTSTEDVPAAPGWVEGMVDEIFALLPQRPTIRALRTAYLDCLAGSGGAMGGPRGDLDAAHDRCRITLLGRLRNDEHVGEATLRDVESRLEAVEAELTSRI